MAHELDFSTGKPAIAYLSTTPTPWHGLGQALTPGQPLEVWRTEAGLDYEVLRSEVLFHAITGGATPYEGKDVLYRSGTGAPLSVVSNGYKIVQPSEILAFFGELAGIGGFEMETAGALSDGKRVWGLAKVSDGAPVIGHDVVRPYVLFATSYDGSMATTAKFTSVRVVCNNTLTMSVGRGFDPAGKTETDSEGRAVSSLVRIPHSTAINRDEIRKSLGIVADVYEKWLVQTRLLAEQPLSAAEAEQFVYNLAAATVKAPSANRRATEVRDTKAYQRIMALFSGELKGYELSGGANRWTMMNACTEYVDFERGANDNSRLSGAWFGDGESLKNKAYRQLAGLEL